MLFKRHRVPLASFSGKKISAIDVYGACKPIDRIDNGMDDISTQRLGVCRAQSLCASGLDFVWRSFHAPPKHIVLPARIDADDGPHSMIVRHDHHPRRPNHVDDGEHIRMKELFDSSALGLSQSFEDCRRVGHRAGQHLTDCFVSWILGKRRAAVSNKPFCLKHEDLHRREGEECHWGAEYTDLMSQKTVHKAMSALPQKADIRILITCDWASS